MKTKQTTLQNNNNTKTTTKSTKKIINWHEYNAALAKRGDITYFVNEAIRAGAFHSVLPTHTKGHPTVYSDQLILLMLTIREILHQPLRQVVVAVRNALIINGL